jgi:sugar/nucleoside kinase (ribokinase family)
MGPKHVIIKRGEYGALHFSADTIFAVPAYPLENVVDPTGAGDTFAGGMMGSLAAAGSNPVTAQHIRQAIAYGTVMASFVVEDFGFERLRGLTREDIDHRYRQFIALTQI